MEGLKDESADGPTYGKLFAFYSFEQRDRKNEGRNKREGVISTTTTTVVMMMRKMKIRNTPTLEFLLAALI